MSERNPTHLHVFDMVITPQAPLFIGSGKILSKKEYLFSPEEQQNRVKLLDETAFFDLLLEKGLMDQYEAFAMEQDGSLWYFLTKTCGLTDTELKRRKVVRYELPVAQKGLLSSRYLKELHTFQRDMHGRAYIPGSSLKGALRTAWLVHTLRSEPDDIKEKRSAQDFSNRPTFPESRYTGRLRVPPHKPNAALDSIFRGIQVSDSGVIPDRDMVLTGRTLLSPRGDPKDLAMCQECVRPGTAIRFRITLDESILCKYKAPITEQSLMDSIRDFDAFYTETFESRFPQPGLCNDIAAPPRGPHLFLGGGPGFFSKTLVYPYLEKDYNAALDWTQEYMKRVHSDRNTGRSKHDCDSELGISPHRMKYVRYAGKLYPAGFCTVSFLPAAGESI